MEDILQRLPHRPPFVMVDRITSGDATVQAQFTIKADNVLVENGFLSESGLVEHMAQAAGAGLPQRNDSNAPVVGYIGALKDLQIDSLPAVGDTITTEISYLHQVMAAHIVKAEVRSASGTLLASCELKIFLQS
jgi:predicted hotdog family 3-hydroxylacyl-ACP dehydratase